MVALIGKKVCEIYSCSISLNLDATSDYQIGVSGGLAREIEEERLRTAREEAVDSGLSEVLFLMEADTVLESIRATLDTVLRRDPSLLDVFYKYYVKIRAPKFFKLVDIPVPEKSKLVKLWRLVGDCFLYQ